MKTVEGQKKIVANRIEQRKTAENQRERQQIIAARDADRRGDKEKQKEDHKEEARSSQPRPERA